MSTTYKPIDPKGRSRVTVDPTRLAAIVSRIAFNGDGCNSEWLAWQIAEAIDCDHATFNVACGLRADGSHPWKAVPRPLN